MDTNFLDDDSIVGFKPVADFYNIINNLTLFPKSGSQESRHFDSPRTPCQPLASFHATEEPARRKHTSHAFYIRSLFQALGCWGRAKKNSKRKKRRRPILLLPFLALVLPLVFLSPSRPPSFSLVLNHREPGTS